jgi:hypothetical protein
MLAVQRLPLASRAFPGVLVGCAGHGRLIASAASGWTNVFSPTLAFQLQHRLHPARR